MAYGVTLTGFVTKTLSQCKAELEEAYRSTFGEGISVDPQSVYGQMIGTHAEREAELWSLLEDLYRAFDPDANEGDAQDAVAAITGALRSPGRRSTVAVVLTGTVNTTVPKSAQVEVDGAGTIFQNQADALIWTLVTWSASTNWTLLGRYIRVVDTDARVYVCRQTGMGGTVAPTGRGTGIVDGGAIWDFVGDGNGMVTATFESVDLGPKLAPAGLLSVIRTPISGWRGIVNWTDAVVGALPETAAEFRLRRETALRATGAAALDAVRADVLAVANVTACTVFENTTGAVDSDGLPAKSIEVLVSGGADQAIRDAIWKSKAAGIETYGTTSGTVTDSQGVGRTVKFSRPVDRLIYLDVSIKIDAATYPADGDTQIIAALAARNFVPGEDVVSWQLKKLITISGVTDVPALEIGLSAWPTVETTFAIAARELAKLDTGRIRITHV